jgi:hypothetical protein
VLAAVLGIAGITGFSTLLANRVFAPSYVLLAASWSGAAILAWIAWTRPSVRCAETLDSWSQTVMHRILRAASVIWPALYLYHCYQWSRLYGTDFGVAHIAPMLLVLPLAIRHEGAAWVVGGWAIVASLMAPTGAAPIALGAASLLLWLSTTTGPRRLVTGSVCAAFVGASLLDGGPFPQVWLAAQTILVLFALAWLHRLRSAALVGGFFTLAGAASYVTTLGRVGVGVALLGLGFASLVLGIWLERGESTSPPGPTAPSSLRPLFTAALVASLLL